MPAQGNEKPDAEGTVKAVQKWCATPVPRVADLDELNTFFRRWCEAERDRVVQSLFGPFTIKDRPADDLAAAAPLTRPFPGSRAGGRQMGQQDAGEPERGLHGMLLGNSWDPRSSFSNLSVRYRSASAS
jgi:hypothetical protein